jgi:hypothetical protein
MYNLLIYFILGNLIVNSLLLLWFFSPFKTTLSEIFLGKFLMPLEFDDYVFSKNKVLGKLVSCWICCSFWLSLLVGYIISIIFNLTIFWCVVTFLCYPAICYLFYIAVKK